MNGSLKASVQAYCDRKGFHLLKRGHEATPGAINIIKRKGKFVLELATVPNSTEMRLAGFTVGYMYPAGVSGLSEQQLIEWFEAN